jgi:hypothetical protein
MAHKDEKLKKAVVEHLAWDNRIDASKDESIARSIAQAFERNGRIDTESIFLTVENGIVTLSGIVRFQHRFGKILRLCPG